MKKAASFFLQFAVFLIVFCVGSFLPPFHFEHVIIATPGTTRIFIADGFLLMLALFLIILLAETLRKHIIGSGPWTVAAFILATAAGFWMEFGYKTISR